jgi:hypothetical protein
VHTYKILVQPVISLLGCFMSTQRLVDAVLEQAGSRPATLVLLPLGGASSAAVPTWLNRPGVLGAVASSAGEQDVVELLDLDSLTASLLHCLEKLRRAVDPGEQPVSPATLVSACKDLLAFGTSLASTISGVMTKLVACTAYQAPPVSALWHPVKPITSGRGSKSRQAHLGQEEMEGIGRAVIDCLVEVMEQPQLSSKGAQPLMLFELLCTLHHTMAWVVWAIASPL